MTEIVLCKWCKHWTAPTREYHKGWGQCDLFDSDMGGPVNPDALAVAQDYEGYSAGLTTRPDFGCVQGELEAHHEG